MYFLVSKVLTLIVVKFFRMTSPKVVCILIQVLTALIIIVFIPYKLVWNESLKSLTVEKCML